MIKSKNPHSTSEFSSLIRKLSILLPIIFLLMTMPATVTAKSAQKVYDLGGLLTDSEERELEGRLSEASRETGQDMIVYTLDSLDGHSIERCAEMAAADIGAGSSGILYIVAMDEREYDIFTFGEMDGIVSDYNRNRLAEDLRPYLSSGDYYGAFTRFCDKAEEMARENDPADISGSFRLSLGIFIGSAVTALVIVLIMRSGMKTTRPEITAGNYVRKGSFRLTVSRDIFLYSSLSRRRIESGSNSHRSGGGHHSGGHSSGKF